MISVCIPLDERARWKEECQPKGPPLPVASITSETSTPWKRLSSCSVREAELMRSRRTTAGRAGELLSSVPKTESEPDARTAASRGGLDDID